MSILCNSITEQHETSCADPVQTPEDPWTVRLRYTGITNPRRRHGLLATTYAHCISDCTDMLGIIAPRLYTRLI